MVGGRTGCTRSVVNNGIVTGALVGKSLGDLEAGGLRALARRRLFAW